MNNRIICGRTSEVPSKEKLEHVLQKHSSLCISIKLAYIYLQFSETAELAMLPINQPHKILEELSDEPFEILGHPQDLKQQAKACPIQLSSLDDLHQSDFTTKLEALTSNSSCQKAPSGNLTPSIEERGTTRKVQECWKSEQQRQGKDCQTSSKQQIRLQDFTPIVSEESRTIKVDFNEQNKLSEKHYTIQQKEQTKIQAIIQQQQPQKTEIQKETENPTNPLFVPSSKITTDLETFSESINVKLEKDEKSQVLDENIEIVCEMSEASKAYDPLPSKSVSMVYTSTSALEESTKEKTKEFDCQNELKKSPAYIWVVLVFWLLFVILF